MDNENVLYIPIVEYVRILIQGNQTFTVKIIGMEDYSEFNLTIRLFNKYGETIESWNGIGILMKGESCKYLLSLAAETFTLIPDDAPPNTSLEIGEPKFVVDGAIYLTAATPIQLIATDNPGGSGVAKTAYRIYNDTYNSGWLTYTGPFNLTQLSDGAYNIDFNSTDNSGNVEQTKTALVILDNTPPLTTIVVGEPKYTADGIYVTPETLFILEAEDSAGSGVHSTTYRIYSNAYDSVWITYIGPFGLISLADGVYTVEFSSTDNLGNVEATRSIQIILFSWNYIFIDSYGRNTALKINIAHKFFRFITPDKDYGIRKATYMRQCGRTIIIKHCDDELRLITIALDTKLDFCIATAWDKQAKKHYLLLDKVGKE
ncbi:MAG: hypothetical protein QXH20_00050 [Candidatus Bathyarchaeia archaeon]